ncbi:hypothetical protein AB6A40_003557 [Gnathostoma spinigerum]|uniref:Uncharacterized protein n=1 Tax=Gnathostoma spinigerum TaxID=75299 RepID=A0ABD6EA28_9BILA
MDPGYVGQQQLRSTVGPTSPMSPKVAPKNRTVLSNGGSPYVSTSAQNQVTPSDGGGVAVRTRPQVPPKPQMDTVRYSMATIQASCDWELDNLLGELSELELQLNSKLGGDQLLLGLPTVPSSKPKLQSTTSNDDRRDSSSTITLNESYDPNTVRLEVGPSSSSSSSSSSVPQEVPHLRARLPSSSVDCPLVQTFITNNAECPSPDHDSAFGDSSSTESRNRCRNSAVSSSDSCRGSLNTPSPTQQVCMRFLVLSAHRFPV